MTSNTGVATDPERKPRHFEHREPYHQHFRAWLRTLKDLAITLAILLVVGLLVHEIWSAWRDERVVVTAFQVPPDLTTLGWNGTVVASGLVDQLQKLQAATRSSQAKREVTDAWTNEVQIEVTEAKIPVAEMQKYLSGLLGHQIRITGSLVRNGANVALTIRGTGFAAKTLPPRDPKEMEQLLADAALYVYEKSEPYLCAAYLQNHFQVDTAIEVAKSSLAGAVPSDKALLLNIWAIGLALKGDYSGSLSKYEEVFSVKPNLWIAYNNLLIMQASLGHEEDAFRTGLRFETAAHRGSWWYSMLPHWIVPSMSPIVWSELDSLRQDLPAEHDENLGDMAANGPEGSRSFGDLVLDAAVLAAMHDINGARADVDQALARSRETSANHDTEPLVAAQADYIRGYIALDLRDYSAAIEDFKEMEDAINQIPDHDGILPNRSCYLALAKEFVGDSVNLDAEIPTDRRFVDCYALRGDIDDHRGKWPEAQEDYKRAVELAPSLPTPYLNWGRALLRHRDYDAAIEKFAEAHKRGQHWADPLEYWGEALAAKGDYEGALTRYFEAAQHAPNWGASYLHWAQSLEKLGMPSEAAKRFQKAKSLVLSCADQKILGAALGEKQ